MSASSIMEPTVVSRLQQLLGREATVADPAKLQEVAIDGCAPQAIALPSSAEEIAATLRVAGEQDWVVVPVGGGTRLHVGRAPERVDLALSLEKLNRILTYDPGDLTISVEAGMRIHSVQAECRQNRQLLPLDTSAGATIGGALASAENGPWRAGFGASRDFCIGVEFITGDGFCGRGGGRVVKNVAGYDLMKLMIGSFGSLGVIVSANFKLFPLPAQTLTCLCEFDSLATLIEFRDWLLRSPLSPMAAEVVNPPAVEYFSDAAPRDPDEWAPPTAVAENAPAWQLALQFAGSDRVLARCRQELGEAEHRTLRGEEEAAFWRGLRNFEQRVMSRHRNALIFQVQVPISETSSAIEAASAAATDYNFLAAVIGRVTTGTFVVAFLTLAIDPPAVTQFASAASAFRSRLSKAASAVVLRCPVEAKRHFDVWGSTPIDLELMRKIKRAMDAKNVLNRGRFMVE
ncbi:MAG TPA: FAD-binding oxidoreductase [Terriglobales bacterium]|nr:FAD-binding oxidoreductase [Terriglobales bacterium]